MNDNFCDLNEKTAVIILVNVAFLLNQTLKFVKKGRLPRLSSIIDMFRRIVGYVVVLLFT